ncbi:LysE family translocator [Halomarina litorea]|uniref:LysE family translocator n=1 Tax=Halomarina litorea TaxID=2961595 RepID=UPI0020C423C4|nr:LysE family translocator [Halomarina sp. BCD28]
MDLGTLALFVPAAVALIVTPGPDSLYVLSRGVGAGRSVGVRAALGVSTGVLVHTAAAALGLSVLFRTSQLAYAVVKYVGAAYLVYLGVVAIRGRDATSLGEEVEAAGGAGDRTGDDRAGGFARGVLVNVLNPKVALFFLAFLPQFASGADAPLEMGLLGATYALLTFAYLGGVAVFSDALGRRLDGREGTVQAASGVVLVGLGVGLLAEGRLG